MIIYIYISITLTHTYIYIYSKINHKLDIMGYDGDTMDTMRIECEYNGNNITAWLIHVKSSNGYIQTRSNSG